MSCSPGDSISSYVLKRLAGFVATLIAASAIVFAVLALLPGNAAELSLGASATPEAVQALEQQLGLDRPAIVRYGRWLVGMLHGELGNSQAYDTPVASLIAERLAVTAPLALIAMALTTLLSLTLGLFAATHHRRVGDAGVMAATQLGLAVPSFWIAIGLVYLFAVKLQWFAAGGFPGWGMAGGGDEGGLWRGLKALMLPALALAAVQTAILARITRTAVLGVLREDFVRTARAKGLGPRAVLWGHVLRNAWVPVLTVMGLQFANLLTGTVVIENVFSLPGLGRLVFQAIANRDLIVVQDVVMLFAAGVIAINFIVDLVSVAIDPRLRLEHR